MKIVLDKPHTHKGEALKPLAEIEVSESTGKWLIANQVGHEKGKAKPEVENNAG